MARTMKMLTLFSGAAFFAGLIARLAWREAWLLSFSITAGVFFYHFAMRLLVGFAVNALLHNRPNPDHFWFRSLPFEKRLYRFLRVKRWKKHLPTYDPSAFSTEAHSWEEILGASCQAEIVHEIIALFSFLPLLLAIPFGDFFLFFFTSFFSALFDLSFVILQRYHRPRLRRVARHKEGKEK